jgi:DNA-binding MarR family transcriptional regulator
VSSRRESGGAAHGVAEDVGILVARVRRVLWARASASLEAAGDSMLAYQVLSHLVKHGPKTQNELANATAQHPAGICRLLTDLEAAELVRRKRDASDMRKVRVAATSKGRARWRFLNPVVVRAIEEVFRPLGAEDLEKLLELLTRVEQCACEPVRASSPRKKLASRR